MYYIHQTKNCQQIILYRSALIMWNFIDSKKNNMGVSKTLKIIYIFPEVSK